MQMGILGSGPVARQLGALFAAAGHDVMLGRRDHAGTTAGELPAGTFADAASFGEIVLVAIPFRVCSAVLPPLARRLAGKTVIDATNPLNEDYSPIPLGPDSSAGEIIAQLVPEANLVKAFNTVFADVMHAAGLARGSMRASAFLCGDGTDAKGTVSALAEQIGMTPVDAGGLLNARYLEAMAHLNINIAFGQGGGTDVAFIYQRTPIEAGRR